MLRLSEFKLAEMSAQSTLSVRRLYVPRLSSDNFSKPSPNGIDRTGSKSPNSVSEVEVQHVRITEDGNEGKEG